MSSLSQFRSQLFGTPLFQSGYLLDASSEVMMSVYDRTLNDLSGSAIMSWNSNGYIDFLASYLNSAYFQENIFGWFDGGNYDQVFNNINGRFFDYSGNANTAVVAAAAIDGIEFDSTSGFSSGNGSALFPYGINLDGNSIIEPYSITRYSSTFSQSIGIDMEYAQLTDNSGSPSLDWYNRNLFANDGMTIALTWTSSSELSTALPFNAAGYNSNGAAALFPYGADMQNDDATNIASLYADYIYGNTTSTPEFPYGLLVSAGNDILTDYMQGTGGGLVNFRGGVSTEPGYGYVSSGGASYHPNGIDLQGQWIYEPALLTRYSAALSKAIDIDMEYGRLTAGGNLSIDWNTRALYGPDGTTLALDWSGGNVLYGVNMTFRSDGAGALNAWNGSTYANCLEWPQRKLVGTDGSRTALNWADASGFMDLRSDTEAYITLANNQNGAAPNYFHYRSGASYELKGSLRFTTGPSFPYDLIFDVLDAAGDSRFQVDTHTGIVTIDELLADNVNVTGAMTVVDQDTTDPTAAVNMKWLKQSSLFLPTVRDISTMAAFANSGTGGAAATASQNGFACYVGTASDGWARTDITNIVTANPSLTGGTQSFIVPAWLALMGQVNPPSADAGRIRIIFGAAASTPALADVDPLSGKGYGAEIYWSTANSRVEIRAFSYDSSISYSAGVAFPVNFDKMVSLVVGSDALGNVKVYGAVGDGSSIPIPTLLITHTGVPTSGVWGQQYIQVTCVAPTGAAATPTNMQINTQKVTLLTGSNP